MRKFLCGCLGAAVLTAAPLFAEEEGDLFSKLDANKDGAVTADEVPDDAKAKFERLLRTGDKDSDGKLSKEEFAAGLKPDDAPKPPLGGAGAGRPGGGQFNFREAFERMDANKDGKVSKDEAQGPLAQNFAAFDGNSDGAVTTEEIAEGFRKLAANRPPFDPKQAEELFNRWDANSDGKLTKEEFPEDRREAFDRIAQRVGSDSLNKEQFGRVAGFLAQQGQPRPQGDRPAEGRPGEGRPGFGFPMGPGPLLRALDADSDGEVSAEEIEAAPKALLKLDRNSDGKLTREELGPPPGDRRPDGDRPGEGRRGANFNPIPMFDKDGDGKLSKEEAPDRMKDNFDNLDRNSDGFVDATELRQAFRGGRPGEGRRPEGDRPREGERRRDGDRPRNDDRRPDEPKADAPKADEPKADAPKPE